MRNFVFLVIAKLQNSVCEISSENRLFYLKMEWRKFLKRIPDLKYSRNFKKLKFTLFKKATEILK